MVVVKICTYLKLMHVISYLVTMLLLYSNVYHAKIVYMLLTL